jgi:tRNA-2-methylthio-N6-dimethylallyladenosine synthase
MKIYIETYGCQMNLSDTEIFSSLLQGAGHNITEKKAEADAILLNTCSVRDNAERKILEKLTHLKHIKKDNPNLLIGILGCMAERMRETLIDRRPIVDFVVGPDEYRRLPEIIDDAANGSKSVAVRLSKLETYHDIEPVRRGKVSAWISIMRGCNNFCSYCIVPYVRGRERSRSKATILNDLTNIASEGFKEVTLLGQNVNSWQCPETGIDFADLLETCAKSQPGIRFRFVTSHPKDISRKLIESIARCDNLCNHIHLALQSGSDRILELMNRKYNSDEYLNKIEMIRSIIPGSSITTDIIAGFPTETEDDHKATMEVMRKAAFEGAFMFKYSPREGTKAFKMNDDIPEEEKIRRLNEIIDLQQILSLESNERDIGKNFEILVEGRSKRKSSEWFGRTSSNKVVVFPNTSNAGEGDFVTVEIKRASSATLFGEIV